jgi:hypothetical protein
VRTLSLLFILTSGACGDDDGADAAIRDGGRDDSGNRDSGSFDAAFDATGFDAGADAGSDAGGDADLGDAGPPFDAGDLDAGEFDAGDVSERCRNESMDFGETDVDCGGLECPPCGTGASCVFNRDCESLACIVRECRAPSCTDGIRNGEESDVDCGGSLCDGCPESRMCSGPDDCRSGICVGGRCALANCEDRVMNGGETDTDCGGPLCPGCPVDDMCRVNRDCLTGSCGAGLVCLAPTCTDGVVNGGETDVDCGGSTTCPRCADLRACAATTDCTSAMCSFGTCGPDPCVVWGMDTSYDGCFFRPLTPTCPDVRATGTNTGLVNDGEMAIPIGFDFDFYGSTYSMLTIAANGAVLFDGTDLTPSSTCLPRAAAPRTFIAPFWDDLMPGGIGRGSVFYQLRGTAPNRKLIVQWAADASDGAVGNPVDVRLVLNETSNRIDICYADTLVGGGSDSGGNATAGIQSGADFLQYSCASSALFTNFVFQYRPR